MGIKFFDKNDIVVRESSKNDPRFFEDNEKYAVNSFGKTFENENFNESLAIEFSNRKIKEKRKKRFESETDYLLLEMQAMVLAGKNIDDKKEYFIEKYNSIKEDLPMSI